LIRALAAIVVLLLCSLAHATPVTFPGAADGVGGEPVDTTLRIRLVDGNGNQVQAARTSDGRPIATDAVYSYDAAEDEWTDSAGNSLGADPLELDMAGQDTLARADGADTYWRWDVRAKGRVETYTVQVADGATPVTWYSLIGATAVEPADITAGRILSLSERAALDAAANTPSAGNPIATLDDISAAGGVGGIDDLADGPGNYSDGDCLISTLAGWEWGRGRRPRRHRCQRGSRGRKHARGGG